MSPSPRAAVSTVPFPTHRPGSVTQTRSLQTSSEEPIWFEVIQQAGRGTKSKAWCVVRERQRTQDSLPEEEGPISLQGRGPSLYSLWARPTEGCEARQLERYRRGGVE